MFSHFIEDYLQCLWRSDLAFLLIEEVHPLISLFLELLLEVLVHLVVIGRVILVGDPSKEIFVPPQEETSGSVSLDCFLTGGVNPLVVIEEVVGSNQCLHLIDQLDVARKLYLRLVKVPSESSIGDVAKDAVIREFILTTTTSLLLFLQGREHARKQIGLGESVILLVPDFATFIVDAELVHEDDQPSERSLVDVSLVEQR